MSVDGLDDAETEGLRRESSRSSEEETEMEPRDRASEAESESENEVPAVKGRKISERRRVQTAQFRSWYANPAGTLYQV